MPKHIKQHSLRGATLIRLSEKCKARAAQLEAADTATSTVLYELADILKSIGASDAKLR